MDGTPASSFYTGLVAELYATLRSVDPDPNIYAAFIRATGEPALELGCGGGDPLLDLREQGLDVEGVDSSADMLDRCHRGAEERGLDVVLHHTTMEAMDLGRTYRSIFLAGATFNLLPDNAAATAALDAIARHLDVNGRALVPLFIPEPVPESAWGVPTEKRSDDGTVMRCTTLSSSRNEEQRRQSSVLRYELEEDGELQVLEREWTLHWHTQHGFHALADRVGLAVDRVVDPAGRPATPASTSFVFLLSRP